MLYPLVRGVYLTLTDANSLNTARTIGVNHIDATYKFIGLDNYADILWGDTAYDRFWSHFIWTIVWTAPVSPCTTASASASPCCSTRSCAAAPSTG